MQRFYVISGVLILGVAASCGGPATKERRSEPEPEVQPEVAPVVVPAPDLRRWSLPKAAMEDPPFPYLPTEDREVSRAVGNTSHGWLVRSLRLPMPQPDMMVLKVQAERDLDYTSAAMWRLVDAAAAHVDRAHPGSILQLGNFSADGGGDIPYSVSHNSGLDGDLGFYLTDESGGQVLVDDLVELDDRGRGVASDGTRVSFDAARNWKLIEGLVRAESGEVQYVFISNPLKKILLEEARRVDADRATIDRAGEILLQPGGALPHSDHFHVRLHCSAVDVSSGCVNEGRRASSFDAHRSAHEETVTRATKLAESGGADDRLAAVRRLGLLGERGAQSTIVARLKDEDPRVRAAAARALSQMGRAEAEVTAALVSEESPFARAEMIWAVADYGTKSSVDSLAELLSRPQVAKLAPDMEVDLRAMVADALAGSDSKTPVEPLIELTKVDDPTVRQRSHRALTMLTNFDPPVTEADLGATWQRWWEKHRKLSRDRWLLLGFKARGHDVDRLALKFVWPLANAVLDADHISYNAQRVLMRLSRREPASLEWSKADANFYWRRWFERRCRRLGCPPVPNGMSTLD